MSGSPEPFDWAIAPPSGRTNAVEAPSAQRQAEGWVENLPIPSRYLNWFWQKIGLTTRRVALFTTQEEAAGALNAGDTCILDEESTAAPWGQASYVKTAVTGPFLAVDVDSERVYHCPGSYAESFPRDLPDGIPAAATKVTYTDAAFSGLTSRAVAADGTQVFIAVGNLVAAFEADTGTLQWTVDHGADVYDLAIADDDKVVAVGALGTGNKHLRVLDKATGSAGGTYQHSASGALYAVAANGRQIFVAGDASSYTSGATVRALFFNGTTVAAATSEGGASVSSVGMAWDYATPGGALRHGCLAADRERLAVARPASHWVQLELLSCADGRTLQDRAIAEEPRGVAMDHGYVYVATSDTDGTTTASTGWVDVYALPDLAHCHRLLCDATAEGGSSQEPVYTVASDGTAVFAAATSAGVITRHRVPVRPALWARIDAAEAGRPPYQKLIPSWRP